MRVSAAVLALCLAAPYVAMPAQADNNNIDFQKAMQDIAAAMKETGDKAAESVATTADQVKQAIDKLKHELEEHHKPIEDTLSQAAHEVADTVKDGAAHVGETIAQAAAAIKEELSDSNHGSLSDDPCWKACTREMRPVCGSDGTSYSNKCVFEIAQCRAGGEGMLKIDHQGRCEAQPLQKDPASCLKACTRDYRPVCASDGKTYSNKCVLEVAQCVAEVMDQAPLKLVHLGKCQEEGKDSCPQFCTMEYLPVCGTNGQTYGNRCALGVAACKHPDQNIEIAHEGECLSGAASAANAMPEASPETKPGCKMDPRVLIGLIVAATVLTALVAIFAARKVHLRRFTRVTTQEVAPESALKLPAYSRLLTEDLGEDDPDELFPPEYTAEGYAPVKTTSSRH